MLACENEPSPSPNQGLPVELLTKIFIYCVFGDECTLTTPVYVSNMNGRKRTMLRARYPIPPPFLLSHVCSLWRSIALSIPQLWTLIEAPSDGDYLSQKRITELYRLWIARSGTMPLSIRVYPSEMCFDSHRAPRSFRLLMRCNNRLETMHLNARNTFIPLNEVYGEAPLLRSFKVNGAYAGAGPVFPFTSCPSLVELTWPDLRSLGEAHVHIPWHQLTHLKLEMVSQPRAAFLFASCPALVHARFSLEPINHLPLRSSSDYLPRFRHNNLLHLELVVACGYNIDSFIDSLALPNLLFLHIEQRLDCHRSPEGHMGVLGADHLTALLKNSACELHTLSLVYLDYDSSDLLSILQTASCSSLHLFRAVAPPKEYNEELSERLLERLSFDSSSSDTLCPDLRGILLMNYSPAKPGMLPRMVSSRFERKNSHFRYFEYYPYKGHDVDMEALRALVKKGHFIKMR